MTKAKGWQQMTWSPKPLFFPPSTNSNQPLILLRLTLERVKKEKNVSPCIIVFFLFVRSYLVCRVVCYARTPPISRQWCEFFFSTYIQKQKRSVKGLLTNNIINWAGKLYINLQRSSSSRQNDPLANLWVRVGGETAARVIPSSSGGHAHWTTQWTYLRNREGGYTY